MVAKLSKIKFIGRMLEIKWIDGRLENRPENELEEIPGYQVYRSKNPVITVAIWMCIVL